MRSADLGDEQGRRAIQRAHNLGVTLFDTAQVYSRGEDDKMIGRGCRRLRDDIVW